MNEFVPDEVVYSDGAEESKAHWAKRGQLMESATNSIVELCKGARRVFMPTIYCPTVAAKIEAVSPETIRYDCGPDLLATDKEVQLADTSIHDVLIWLHPFGQPRRPPAIEAAVVADGCHSLLASWRSADMLAFEQVSTVFSLRKDLGLPSGALILGDAALSARGAETEIRFAFHEFQSGRLSPTYVTALQVRDEIGNVLPRHFEDMTPLTTLTLASADRERVVTGLRGAGINAWYWPEQSTRWSSRSTRILDAQVFYVHILDRAAVLFQLRLCRAKLSRWT